MKVGQSKEIIKCSKYHIQKIIFMFLPKKHLYIFKSKVEFIQIVRELTCIIPYLWSCSFYVCSTVSCVVKLVGPDSIV